MDVNGNGNYTALNSMVINNWNNSNTRREITHWGIAIASMVEHSIMVVDMHQHVVHINNPWGTFDTASTRTLKHMLIYLNKKYSNSHEVQIAYQKTIDSKEAGNFILLPRAGGIVVCKSAPVYDEVGDMCGVVMVAKMGHEKAKLCSWHDDCKQRNGVERA